MNFKHLYYFWATAKAGGIMRAGRSFVVRAQPHAPHAFALEIKLAPDVDHQRQFGRNRNAEAKL